MSTKGIIHVIDDEPVIHDVLAQLLTAEGFEVEISASAKRPWRNSPPSPSTSSSSTSSCRGWTGSRSCGASRPSIPQAAVIIITAYGSVESAIAAMKIGALDYVQKPFKHDVLLMAIEKAIERKRLQDENVRLKDELRQRFSFANIIGKSQAMKGVFDLVKAAAPTRSTILLQGESGTGKELVAKAIHLNSNRAEAPFVTVNSGSLPPDLLESHLFGHVKGAFTGAVALKKGLFEAADKGTIFFDEISSISLETQAKLLRVMQEKEFMRLGGTQTIKVDVRILAATNTDIEGLIAEKAFRKDLFYRLNVIKIEIPPAARAEGGHPPARQALRRDLRPREQQGDRGGQRGRPRGPRRPQLAGQRPRAREPRRTGHRPDPGQGHHPGLPAAVLPAGGRRRRPAPRRRRGVPGPPGPDPGVPEEDHPGRAQEDQGRAEQGGQAARGQADDAE